MSEPLSKKDYEEPACLLNMYPEVTPIPTGRVIEKLDEYLGKNEYDAAERHLSYWLSEAEAGYDRRGKLTVLNEQIGLFRKTGKEEECLRVLNEALSLSFALREESPVTYGTTLVNAATGYKAFGMAGKAVPLYREACAVYERELPAGDRRFAGLYNNMALALTDTGSYEEARSYYEKAIDLLREKQNGQPEMAVTYLNLADLSEAEKGPLEAEEEIRKYLSKAEDLLHTEGIPKDGNYAYVCEKCAPVFGYYGYFFTEEELRERAEEIYRCARLQEGRP